MLLALYSPCTLLARDCLGNSSRDVKRFSIYIIQYYRTFRIMVQYFRTTFCVQVHISLIYPNVTIVAYIKAWWMGDNHSSPSGPRVCIYALCSNSTGLHFVPKFTYPPFYLLIILVINNIVVIISILIIFVSGWICKQIKRSVRKVVSFNGMQPRSSK